MHSIHRVASAASPDEFVYIHTGTYADAAGQPCAPCLAPGDAVRLAIDAKARMLNSRLHSVRNAAPWQLGGRVQDRRCRDVCVAELSKAGLLGWWSDLQTGIVWHDGVWHELHELSCVADFLLVSLACLAHP